MGRHGAEPQRTEWNTTPTRRYVCVCNGVSSAYGRPYLFKWVFGIEYCVSGCVRHSYVTVKVPALCVSCRRVAPTRCSERLNKMAHWGKIAPYERPDGHPTIRPTLRTCCPKCKERPDAVQERVGSLTESETARSKRSK